MLAFITARGTATYAEIRLGCDATPEELDASLRGMVARRAVIQKPEGYQRVGYHPRAGPPEAPDSEDEPAAPATIRAPEPMGKRTCVSCQKATPMWHFEDNGVECRRCVRHRIRREFAKNRPPRSVS